jgi:hypothetical protein
MLQSWRAEVKIILPTGDDCGHGDPRRRHRAADLGMTLGKSEGLEIAWFTVGSFSNSPHYQTGYAILIALIISAERSSGGTGEMVV